MAERTTLVHAPGGDEPAPAAPGAPSPPAAARPAGRAGAARRCAYGLLLTARPRQWVKNVLVAAAPAAAGQLDSFAVAVRLALVFALFTTAASAVYLLNDARDAEADRAHPDKCRRPVAAGTVPVGLAYAVGGVLAPVSAVAAALCCNAATAVLLAGYVAMQIAYCLVLKRILVIDLAVVTAGFVMRAMCGGLALGIPLSRWFLITAGFGALFMVAAKRYSEALLVGEGEGETRALLREYTVSYLRFVWQLAAGAAVLAYCLWALESDGGGGSLWRQLSMVPLLLAVLRYAVFADRGAAGSPEDVLLRDRPLAVTGLCWGLLYGLSVAAL
ncbi:decaprenyl-phosphate phosphoribosyltransferase [Streptomyces axinellae]|uniref:Decaprenyl-phosphate phosphoribosyltransferase n=1 Tax=Streptomyces axinellae TaxID=552788 RepID=A0ABN3QVL1_9ACTN